MIGLYEAVDTSKYIANIFRVLELQTAGINVIQNDYLSSLLHT